MVFYIIIAIAFGAGLLKQGATITEAGAAGAAWPYYLLVAVFSAAKQAWNTLAE
jgi:hypothetical protein